MSHTLVLNASYEPLCIVPLRRAVVLVLSEKAVTIDHAEEEVRSSTVSMRAPKVIRLTRYVKVPYRTRLPLSKRNVLARDNHRCAYCEAKATTVDHVQPRARGGNTAWENLVACCLRCNGRKGSKLVSELGWTLHVTPTVPTGQAWLVIAVSPRDAAWEPYLNPGLVPALS